MKPLGSCESGTGEAAGMCKSQIAGCVTVESVERSTLVTWAPTFFATLRLSKYLMVNACVMVGYTLHVCSQVQAMSSVLLTQLP